MWELPDDERARHISMLKMYRYQRRVNDPQAGRIFRDKVRFRRAFAPFLANTSFDATAETDLTAWLDAVGPKRVAIKEPQGQNGLGVRLLNVTEEGGQWRIDGKAVDEALRQARQEGFTLIESEIVQHPDMAAPNPQSVNTVRVMTRVRPTGTVEVIGACLRVGNGTDVDNLVAGGLGALVDAATGTVRGPLLSRDPWDRNQGNTHPSTGHHMDGMQIPFWPEALQMVKRASRVVPGVRTVGWDVAITPQGPCLIEGNENWDKTLWELPSPDLLGPRVDAWLAEERAEISDWALSWSKRAMDVILASGALIVTAPIWAAVGAIVRLGLDKPVIFTQPRPGQAGRTFIVRKFRTMTNETGPDGTLLPREQRLTALGRRLRALSLDELPELLNVLTGDMSIVGPRPLRVEYLPHYSPEQAARHYVRPGITGLAQVSGRERLDWEQRFALDREYVRSASLRLDLEILRRTVVQVMSAKEAEPEQGPFVTPFAGAVV
jgi:lipopolysaccharide/colanic/teichoic acid biosynthesis glycosyltransferase